MKHNYLNNLPLDEAKALYAAHLRAAGFSATAETVRTADANGRILAKAVYAKICSPHYNASAMDGVAVRAEDTYPICTASWTRATRSRTASTRSSWSRI